MDGVDAMSGVSGIPRPEVLEIWEQVKRNHATLDACVGPHRFIPIGDARLGCRFVCELCRGEVGVTEKHWYGRGLEHGQKVTP